MLDHLRHPEIVTQPGFVRSDGDGRLQASVRVDQADAEGVVARPDTAAGDVEHLLDRQVAPLRHEVRERSVHLIHAAHDRSPFGRRQRRGHAHACRGVALHGVERDA